ncbi:MAG: Tol-Pal system protein TolB [Alphaproteobacteria bacterium]|nr:Tol-Pal system protein TolB [Alphaproteobacteria bacterium]
MSRLTKLRTYWPLLLALAGSAPLLAQAPAPLLPGTPAPAATPVPNPDAPIEITGGTSSVIPIAIPDMPTPHMTDTLAGSTDVLGHEVAQVITTDLRNSGLFTPTGTSLPSVSMPQVTAPDFAYWSSNSTSKLVEGFVLANAANSLTIGCYLYDVPSKSELARQGYKVAAQDWRRAAHKCADVIYARLTGEGAYFDSRIVYIAESGPKAHRIKRLAIMDQDGANHHFLTNGQTLVLTPHVSPDHRSIVYMSYLGQRGRIYTYDIASGKQRLVVDSPNLTFAPRISPHNTWVLFSQSIAGETNIYRIPFAGGTPEALTATTGINTGGSYSPDGSKIVFESDRSGGQQLYVMNADGSDQHRISFGAGRYATPAWSPRGDLIAFTHLGAGHFRIGVMTPAGSGEHLLTNSWQDEGPSWSPNGRVLTFARLTQNSGKSEIMAIDYTGANERHIVTPLDGSDPAWGGLLP